MDTYTEQEKPDYNWIKILPDNEVILLMPLCGSDANIARDNTCKTTETLKKFFETDAMQSLNSMAQDLEIDIQTLSNLGCDAAVIEKKEERLNQVILYRDTVLAIREEILSGIVTPHDYYELPSALNKLFDRKIKDGANLGTMLLCPLNEDNWTIGPNQIFALNRRTLPPGEDYTLENGDRSQLARQLTELTFEPRETFIQKVKNAFTSECETFLNSDEDDTQLLNKITQIEFLTGLTSVIQLEEILEQIKAAAMIEETETLKDAFNDPSELAELIFNSFNQGVDNWEEIAGNQQTALIAPPDDNESPEIEKFSNTVQFYLGVINADLHFAGILDDDDGKSPPFNMGRIFEKPNIVPSFVKKIKDSINNGAKIEDAILDYITDFHKHFGIKKDSITSEVRERIKQKFHTQYQVIKDSPQFDEFITIRPKEIGDLWMEYKYTLACPFFGVINSCFPDLADDHTRHIEETYRNTELKTLEASPPEAKTFNVTGELGLDAQLTLAIFNNSEEEAMELLSRPGLTGIEDNYFDLINHTLSHNLPAVASRLLDFALSQFSESEAKLIKLVELAIENNHEEAAIRILETHGGKISIDNLTKSAIVTSKLEAEDSSNLRQAYLKKASPENRHKLYLHRGIRLASSPNSQQLATRELDENLKCDNSIGWLEWMLEKKEISSNISNYGFDIIVKSMQHAFKKDRVDLADNLMDLLVRYLELYKKGLLTGAPPSNLKSKDITEVLSTALDHGRANKVVKCFKLLDAIKASPPRECELKIAPVDKLKITHKALNNLITENGLETRALLNLLPLEFANNEQVTQEDKDLLLLSKLTSLNLTEDKGFIKENLKELTDLLNRNQTTFKWIRLKRFFYKQILRTPLAQRAIKKFVKHEQANYSPSYYAYIDARKTLIAPVSGDCNPGSTASGRLSTKKAEITPRTSATPGINLTPSDQHSDQEDPDHSSPRR